MATPRPTKPVDASMDLLKQVIDQPIDPDYAVVAKKGEQSSPRGWIMAFALIAVGALLAVAIMQNFNTAPVRATERDELIARINEVAQRQDDLRTDVEAREAEIRRLQESALGSSSQDRELRERLAQLELQAASIAVTGPGLVITVDDGPGDDAKGQVIDIDLQQLVNGLWVAGAEAIAINGHRISSRTAIRGAGSAITVNYRSLTRPYRIEVIGDPNTLAARYAESTGGIWWASLKENYRVRHDVASARTLTLPADSGLGLRYARKGK